MKIKNLAFFGIMAAIMGVAGTARADTTTVIASQAYVDAKDALKQNILNSGANGNVSVTAGNGTTTSAITGVTANGDGTVTFTTQDIAIPGASNFVEDSITDGHTDKAPSGNAVYDEIHVASDGNYIRSTNTVAQNLNALDTRAKTNADNISTNTTNISTNTTNISTNTSAIEALNKAIEKGLTPEQQTLYDAWVEAGRKPTDITQLLTDMGVEATDNIVSDYQKGHQNLIPRNRNIQKGIAYLKGSGIEHYTAGVTFGNTENVGIENDRVKSDAASAWRTNMSDDYVPTVASVERRVQAVEATVSAIDQVNDSITDGNTDTAPSENAVYDALALKQNEVDSNVVAGANETLNYITAGHGVAANLKALDTRAKTNADNIATNTASITTLNGDVSTAGSVLKSIKENAATGDFDANESYATGTIGKAIKEAGTNAINTLNLSDNATEQPVTEVDQTNGQIAVTRGTISYAQGLKYDLSNINSPSGDGSAGCRKGSPCTLTMFMHDGKPVYEWTNMDTENTDAVL